MTIQQFISDSEGVGLIAKSIVEVVGAIQKVTTSPPDLSGAEAALATAKTNLLGGLGLLGIHQSIITALQQRKESQSNEVVKPA